MSAYPVWLLDRAARAIDPDAWEPESPERYRSFAREQAEAVLDALGFMPNYRAFNRAGRVHADTDTWEGTAVSPELQERRRNALAELTRLSEELGEQ